MPWSGVDGVRRWSDGNLASSCFDYRNGRPEAYQPSILSGLYRVSSDGIESNVFCDMETDGGGWTLVGHYRHPASENAVVELDGRDYSYFMRARTDEAYGSAEFFGDPNSRGTWTDWRQLNAIGFPLEFAVVLDEGIAYQAPWDGHAAKVIYKIENRDLMPNYGTEQDITAGEGVMYKLHPERPWVDLGNASSSGTYFWYPKDVNGANLTLLHVSNYAYIDNRPATNYQYSAYYGRGVPGGDDSWQHGARLWVRQTQ